METQEALVPIEHLAESFGIKKVLEDYEGHPDVLGSCRYVRTLRERYAGCLYAHIEGDQLKVGLVSSIDPREFESVFECWPWKDCFDEVDELLIEEDAVEHIDLADRAYLSLSDAFEHEAFERREMREALLDVFYPFWPELIKLVADLGTVYTYALKILPPFNSLCMPDYLEELEEQGIITSVMGSREDAIRLTKRACELLGIDETPKLVDAKERIMFFLERCGALSAVNLQHAMGMDNGRTHNLLRKLIDEGKVVSYGRGRARRFELVRGVQADA